jgi:PIN domain nuclease of toxin-antitoxin system
MRLLLDSHVIVWWALYPGRLRPETREVLTSGGNQVHMSAASIWELGLKMARGKLSLPDGYAERLLHDGLAELPVRIAHAAHAASLPALHGDPFDRILIAQALTEGLILVTSDRAIARYDVPIMEP